MKPTATATTASFKGLIGQLPSAESRRAYEADWARYLVWLELEGICVLDAKPRHVAAHIAHLREKEMAKSTTGRALSIIREIYGAFVRDELIESNPAREVKNPKVGSTPKTPWLSEEQMRILLNLPADTWEEKRDRLCVQLLFGLGWRRSEVARLTVANFHEHTVDGLFKGSKRVTVGVPPWVKAAVDAWLEYAGTDKASAILPRSLSDPRPVSADIVYNIVKRAGKRAGFPSALATPHALRRTNITLGGKRGVALKIRQLAVGHTSQSTTERYDHARDAAENAPGEVFADLVAPVPAAKHGERR